MISDWKEFRSMALGLLEDGYVPVFGEFCDELEEIVVECILAAKRKGVKKLTLLINSNGGRDDCFNGIKAAMTMTEVEFTGLVMSRARSNGFRLLQHCHRRSAIRDAMLEFHWGTYRLENSEIAAILEGDSWPIDHLKAWRNATLQEVHERTSVSTEDLKRYAQYERSFTAEEAKALNFVDEIVSDLPAKVREKARKSKGKK